MPRGLARDHADKRAHIRERAAAYFAERGFDRASMAGAARACGVSKALLYHYHASKEALLHDILETHLSDLVAIVESVGEAEPEPRLRRLIAAILDAYRDADAEHKLQLDALATLPPELRQPLVTLQRRLVAIMADALSAHRPDLGDDRIRALAMSVFGMLNWFFLWHRPDRDMARESYAGLVADLVLGGLPAVRS
ncbi:TetR/AcrR family transcriptional regulator [Ostreiculturibacter nitratireducens]|uniref:TetR/AcrR family transcriptional regulator n=1 Tax=Ostreiculturibacter nitratireducens TaxID=3075226 RepID=UPI0031B5AF82